MVIRTLRIYHNFNLIVILLLLYISVDIIVSYTYDMVIHTYEYITTAILLLLYIPVDIIVS
jgi:hypothetical protein